jgi:hypothetical protein
MVDGPPNAPVDYADGLTCSRSCNRAASALGQRLRSLTGVPAVNFILAVTIFVNLKRSGKPLPAKVPF